MTVLSVPRAFVWRRVHSLMGLWLTLFLMEHLLTNSQAALWLGENARGFVAMVNALHNLPYLQVIEVILLGVPLLIHGVLGIKYLLTSRSNSIRSDGSKPYIPLGRNRAYSWQRITSWVLLIGLILHVTKFRFLDYPETVQVGTHTFYLVDVKMDEGLYTVADRLNVSLFDEQAIKQERTALNERGSEKTLLKAAESIRDQNYDWKGPIPQSYNSQKAMILTAAERYEDQVNWVERLESHHLMQGEVVAASTDFGIATVLAVRDTFKNPIYCTLYTIFVLAACFHAFNGFWTFLITWGWVLKMAAQRAWVTVAIVLMLVILFLGLAAIWGTYWVNLRY